MKNLIFVDCEAFGPCPVDTREWVLTEFGAVDYRSRESFHGQIWERLDNPDQPEVAKVGRLLNDRDEIFHQFNQWVLNHTTHRAIFVSDNPAYDWQWINHGFAMAGITNPFGHSARRISDYYAGLTQNFQNTQAWKRLRITEHDHNPVHDAFGNVEAFARMQAGERA